MKIGDVIPTSALKVPEPIEAVVERLPATVANLWVAIVATKAFASWVVGTAVIVQITGSICWVILKYSEDNFALERVPLPAE